jgi:hypothetical protein
MAVGETPGPSGTRPDRYFEDISADELSANAPADETNDDKNAAQQEAQRAAQTSPGILPSESRRGPRSSRQLGAHYP